ncbi:MAG: hypothetical protein IKT43_00015 [Clostridia bacterium]|nr:hypothetical protein [Clostridia bacterium]
MNASGVLAKRRQSRCEKSRFLQKIADLFRLRAVALRRDKKDSTRSGARQCEATQSRAVERSETARQPPSKNTDSTEWKRLIASRAGAVGAGKSKTCFHDLPATDAKGGKAADQPFKSKMAVL